MASVIVTPTAQRNLATLIETHSLPGSTLARFRRTLEPLRDFPLVGVKLRTPGPELRFIVGPWRWMIVVYRYYDEADQVRIISVHDARSARLPTEHQDNERTVAGSQSHVIACGPRPRQWRLKTHDEDQPDSAIGR